MKRALFLLGLISLIGLVIIGCSGGGSPSGVVRQLHTAVEKRDRNAISDIMVSDAYELLFKFYTLDELQEMLAKSGGISKMEENIDKANNTAVVEVTYKNGESDTYDLVKVDGKWKITLELDK